MSGGGDRLAASAAESDSMSDSPPGDPNVDCDQHSGVQSEGELEEAPSPRAESEVVPGADSGGTT